MGYIDFHCHLDATEFSENRSGLIERIFSSGVSELVTVADPYTKGSHELSAGLAEKFDHIHIMSAAHPHQAGSYSSAVEKKIFKLAEHRSFIGIGEAGLDFHYNFSSPDDQIRVFRRQVEIASELGKPLIIHSREAESHVLGILEECRFKHPVIFHCYTGNMVDAKEIVARGFSISFSGIVTFKKADYLREIALMTPMGQLFTETDSPYLSPEPFRGKVNDPSRVRLVADEIAKIKGISSDVLNRTVLKNLESVIKS